MFLLGDEFSAEQKKRNFDYYDPLTTGDSSLSVSVQTILAAELGYMDKAAEYAQYALLMDLADVAGNVKDGCHIASIGGTWMAVVYGLAGMRDYNGRLHFEPNPPMRKGGLGTRFPLTVQGQVMEVHIDREKGVITYSLRKGSELVITHRGEEIRLKEGAPVARKLAPVKKTS
jgi:alpha,alpha-trehalose phosphorylase